MDINTDVIPIKILCKLAIMMLSVLSLQKEHVSWSQLKPFALFRLNFVGWGLEQVD